MSLEEIIEEVGKENVTNLLKELKRQKFSEVEVKHVLKHLKQTNPRKYNPLKIHGRRKHIKFGIMSDLHIGHRNYRGDVLTHAAKEFEREEIDFIVNAGDTLEGMSGRDGHIYELLHLGFSEQMKALEYEFKKIKDYTVYSIEASNSHTGWYNSKGNQGVDAGAEIERRVPNYKFLGYDEQDLIVNNLKIRLRHPGGGTAYANSYKMQKYVASLPGGDKPNIVVQGHFHKALYQIIRNIHCIDAGALQDQSLFMKKKGSPSHVCYWIADVKYNKQGIEKFKVEQVPFYD